MDDRNKALHELRDQWQKDWEAAIADWSPYVQLHEPIWCLTAAAAKRESLTGSFAMIRLQDHSVVINLAEILDRGLGSFSHEILAHEIGHHVYCPADLTDNARLLARTRRGLPGNEAYAPMIANLYADLLINDQLQRTRHRNMAGVYQAIETSESKSKLWQLYLRTYEILWELPQRQLTHLAVDRRINQDAVLCARLIRSYSKDWLQGAGRFACLYLPYVIEDAAEAEKAAKAWCDTLQAGSGGCPDGLTEIDEDELNGNIHPAEDPALSGLDPIELDDDALNGQGLGKTPSSLSGRKTIKNYRDPFEYAEILKASGATLNEREVACRYYRERATPFLIRFPSNPSPVATEPIPEGIDVWDANSEIERIDWASTVATSPIIIPGVTTKERLEGMSTGSEPERIPLDLYLGVDCSGSMRDPAITLSYPVLAGAIMALSALRAGARVKVVLSGEPGKTVSTDGFVRNPMVVLEALVNYLGTGYSFGIHRLRETFDEFSADARPVHILILSDYDMFSMLESQGDGEPGWDVAKRAVAQSRGGATYVLQLPGYEGYASTYGANLNRMKADGWSVSLVNSMEELVAFAREFSKRTYES